MDRHLHNAMMAQYATPKVSGDGLVSWDKGVKCVMPSVKLYGAAVQDGTPTPDAPIMPVCNDGVFKATGPDGAYDGGKAAAPELWAITGTECRDEWDAQTGWGVKRVKKLVLDGSENIYKYTYMGLSGVHFPNVLDTKYRFEKGICSHCSKVARTFLALGDYILVGVNDKSIFWVGVLDALGLSSVDDFRDWLSAQCAAGTPLTVWYALAEPEPFYFAPARLTMPNGFGKIIQVSGSVPECPIEVNYLTHAGGAK